VYVIGQHLQLQDFNTEFDGHLVADFFQAIGDGTGQGLMAKARNPYKRVTD
jgi:hypothetical protein